VRGAAAQPSRDVSQPVGAGIPPST